VKRLEVALYEGPAVRAPADALLAPIPEDERPLRGDAGRLDWRLGGEISRLLLSGYASGRRGEAVLLAGGARVGSRKIVLVGVGRAADLPGRNLSRAIRAAMARLLALHAGSAALALPEAVDPEMDAEDLLRGMISALAAAPERTSFYLVAPDASRHSRAWERAVGALASEAAERGVALGAYRTEKPAA
jgi:hypothetical protein